MNSTPLTQIDFQSSSLRDPAAHALLLTAAGAGTVIAVLDLLTHHVILPIVYIIPLLLIEPLARRRLLWQAAGTAVILTFLCFFFGSRPAGATDWSDFTGPALLNRTLAAIAILSTAAVLHVGLALRQPHCVRREWPHDPDGQNFQRVLFFIEQTLAPVLAIIFALGLFLCDVLAPAEYNIALLYGLPLIILARTRSVPVIWTAMPLLVLAALCGLWLGPELGNPAHRFDLALNRIIACIAIVSGAVVLHARLRKVP